MKSHIATKALHAAAVLAFLSLGLAACGTGGEEVDRLEQELVVGSAVPVWGDCQERDPICGSGCSLSIDHSGIRDMCRCTNGQAMWYTSVDCPPIVPPLNVVLGQDLCDTGEFPLCGSGCIYQQDLFGLRDMCACYTPFAVTYRTPLCPSTPTNHEIRPGADICREDGCGTSSS